MDDSLGKGRRPSSGAVSRKNRAKYRNPQAVEIMRARFESGLGLFDGEVLPMPAKNQRSTDAETLCGESGKN